MSYALVWSVTVVLLALWSFTVWALNAVSVWTLSHAGDLGGAASGVGALRLPEWLAIWVPQEIVQAVPAMLADLAPFVQAVLETAPVLAGGVTVLAWVIWTLGSLMLIGAGVAGHLGMAVWRRRVVAA
ncbi:hypothetical protein [Sphaerotilus mobilis]|uniref:Uncharacterized protein n=1 Tax=Sphaerotilus mobilis TaxID=47994 RepID=A0A4Q7LG27_9BURK|nr:hypothetical protein [Sphaerotilus mobilis]RZS53144.1 hypothetical protein EV685_2769 [Sphaerotilus mobilis]